MGGWAGRRVVRAALSIASACVLVYALSVTLFDTPHVASSMLAVLDDPEAHAAAAGTLADAFAGGGVAQPEVAAAAVVDAGPFREALVAASQGGNPAVVTNALVSPVAAIDPARGAQIAQLGGRLLPGAGPVTSRSPLVWAVQRSDQLVPAGLAAAGALLVLVGACPGRARGTVRAAGRWAVGVGALCMLVSVLGPRVVLVAVHSDAAHLAAHFAMHVAAPLAVPGLLLTVGGVAVMLLSHASVGGLGSRLARVDREAAGSIDSAERSPAGALLRPRPDAALRDREQHPTPVGGARGRRGV